MSHMQVQIIESVLVKDLDQYPRAIYKNLDTYVMDKWHLRLRGTWAKVAYRSQMVAFIWR